MSRRVIGIGICWAVSMALAPIVASQGAADQPPPAFSGTATADGTRLVVTVPGGPVTDSPVDGGGPTAQVTLDSVGNSRGYAAFPDPGELVVSAPGLITGFLGAGAGGLPPTKLPTLPPYPLYIASDASTQPDVSAGAGAYGLTASSQSTSSQATASGGVQGSPAGNVGLVTSKATVAVTSTSSVVATSVTDTQGLTLGPLTIGEVKSQAAETLNADGSVTPRTSMQINGISIGGVPVSVTPTGLLLGGPRVPLPINASLASLLKASGVQVAVQPGQESQDKVIAPALVITAPVQLQGVSKGLKNGTMTLTLGVATAQLTGTTHTEGGNTAAVAGGESSGGEVAAGSPPETAGSVPTAVATGPALAPSGTAVGPAGPAANGTSGGATSAVIQPASFGILSLYLLLAMLAVMAFGVGQLFRLLGVRGPWISSGG